MQMLHSMSSGIGDCRMFSSNRKRIFPTPPHLTVDNHFSGEDILDYTGKGGLESHSQCFEIYSQLDWRSTCIQKRSHQTLFPTKVMCFQNPILAIKQVKATNTTKTRSSFLFTGPTSMGGVNILPSRWKNSFASPNDFLDMSQIPQDLSVFWWLNIVGGRLLVTAWICLSFWMQSEDKLFIY